jgi:hypothetical protein
MKRAVVCSVWPDAGLLLRCDWLHKQRKLQEQITCIGVNSFQRHSV